ncbi:hypothetical protein Pcinc_022259 [Petrolisthes cinctipes]|uniref:Uncharacterized protein n=1 Tax=Petrolisthes cinctipes TaxID=88211 RepID=A0AAE1FI44_PETCI|nr:hypothetical protein Pcinc_022259 [Petrolisthes cinctipes]
MGMGRGEGLVEKREREGEGSGIGGERGWAGIWMGWGRDRGRDLNGMGEGQGHGWIVGVWEGERRSMVEGLIVDKGGVGGGGCLEGVVVAASVLIIGVNILVDTIECVEVRA